MREVRIEPTLESWRAAARALVAERVPPEEVIWIQQERPQQINQLLVDFAKGL